MIGRPPMRPTNMPMGVSQRPLNVGQPQGPPQDQSLPPQGQFGANAAPGGNAYGHSFMQQYGSPPGQMRPEWDAFKAAAGVGQPPPAPVSGPANQAPMGQPPMGPPTTQPQMHPQFMDWLRQRMGGQAQGWGAPQGQPSWAPQGQPMWGGFGGPVRGFSSGGIASLSDPNIQMGRFSSHHNHRRNRTISPEWEAWRNAVQAWRAGRPTEGGRPNRPWRPMKNIGPELQAMWDEWRSARPQRPAGIARFLPRLLSHIRNPNAATPGVSPSPNANATAFATGPNGMSVGRSSFVDMIRGNSLNDIYRMGG